MIYIFRGKHRHVKTIIKGNILREINDRKYKAPGMACSDMCTG